ncbi:hypothetical protein [uncultured Shimia sp.]|uniref:hypothetical protein n=1 Tax=uncultured Shimia sp. TaxID=573152 RepID=UPI0026073F8D|nr:hypothetical protein [uncultured Shimia sp.]
MLAIRRPLFVTFAVLVLWIAVTVYDRVVLDIFPLRKLPPILDGYYFARGVFSLIAAWCIACSLSWSDYPSEVTPYTRAAGILGWLSAIIASSILVTFLISPPTLTVLGRVDSLIEWISFSALMLAAALFAASVRHAKQNIWLVGALVLLSIGSFLTGMEEVSWLQPVLGIETTPLFAENWQYETNFHNFYTHEIEVVYYIVGAILLCLVPVVLACAPAAKEFAIYRISPKLPVAYFGFL